MPSILDLMGHIQQQGEEGRQRGLASLVGKAYAQPDQRQQILGTVAERGAPGMAMQAQQGFSKMDETAASDLAREAGMFVALAQSGDEQTIQTAYQQLARKAQASGHPVPMQYNPSFLPGIQQLASAGQKGDGIPADIRTLQILRDDPELAALDAKRRQAPKYVWTDRGLVAVSPDGATPVGYGGGSPQLAPNSAYQTPSGIVRIGDVAPEDMGAVEADMRSGGASDSYRLPDRDVSGGIVQPPAKAAPVPTPPSGYRYVGDRLEPIPGGPADTGSGFGGDPSNPLAGLSPADAALVQKLAHYQMLPSSLGRSKNRAELMARAAMLNPDFNEANAKQAYTYLNDLSKSGPTSAGGQAASVNTALHHLGTLMKINAQLKTGAFPLLNRASNALKTATGSAEVTQWKQATNFVAQEMAKLVKGGVANEGEMRDILNDLDVAGSQEQRNQAISRAAEFLYGRIHAIEERGQRALGEMDPGTSLMTPEAQKLLEAAFKLGGRIAPELLPAQQAGSFTRNSTTPRPPAPQSGGVDDLLSKYGVK